MSLLNKDENKTFGAVFRTPVENSKGIPHILEHSVLCGSKKYPIKEPFVELMKGSLNTFLNAFTYPDRTCYPVASTNLQARPHPCLCHQQSHSCVTSYVSPSNDDRYTEATQPRSSADVRLLTMTSKFISDIELMLLQRATDRDITSNDGGR